MTASVRTASASISFTRKRVCLRQQGVCCVRVRPPGAMHSLSSPMSRNPEFEFYRLGYRRLSIALPPQAFVAHGREIAAELIVRMTARAIPVAARLGAVEITVTRVAAVLDDF